MPAKAVAAGRETTPGSGHQRRQRPSTRSRSRTWPHRDDGALKEQNRSRRDPSRRTKRSVEREWYQPTRKRNLSPQCAFPLSRSPKKRRMEERHPRGPHREDHAVAPRSAYPSDGHRKPPRRLHLSATRRGGEFLTDVADLILPQGEDAAQRDLGKRWTGAALRAPPQSDASRLLDPRSTSRLHVEPTRRADGRTGITKDRGMHGPGLVNQLVDRVNRSRRLDGELTGELHNRNGLTLNKTMRRKK